MLYTKELAEQIRKAIDETEIKVEDDEEYTFDVIATTEDTDRDNEVIKVNGWDTRNWEKNPVILANHDYTLQSIIGKGLKFYTSNGQKRLKGVFSKSNPLGQLAKNLYEEGMLKTVSVGFIPLKRNEQDYKIIEKAELLEVSFVAVPANPNATSLDGKLYNEAVEKGLIQTKMEQEEINEIYSKYKDTVNMSYSQLKAWSETECSKQASNSREPITRNLKLLDTNKSDWTESDVKEANKTISFIARMKENLGGENVVTLEDGTECGTKAYISLKNWAYDANKTKTLTVKQSEMEELKKEIAEIKELLKSNADDKVEIEEDEVKKKKELIQSINKGTAKLLENMKKL